MNYFSEDFESDNCIMMPKLFWIFVSSIHGYGGQLKRKKVNKLKKKNNNNRGKK